MEGLNDSHPSSLFVLPFKREIEQAQSGSQSAMRLLYDAHAKAMLNTSYRILNSQVEAEDVVQESFVGVFKNLDRFHFKSTFGAYLKRIVINKSIDELRKKKKVQWVELNDEVRSSDFEWNDLPLEEVDLLDQVYQAMHNLPHGYRTVFSLYCLEGYDHQEISEILDIGVSTSISQLSRAKVKLKQELINMKENGRVSERK